MVHASLNILHLHRIYFESQFSTKNIWHFYHIISKIFGNYVDGNVVKQYFSKQQKSLPSQPHWTILHAGSNGSIFPQFWSIFWYLSVLTVLIKIRHSPQYFTQHYHVLFHHSVPVFVTKSKYWYESW